VTFYIIVHIIIGYIFGCGMTITSDKARGVIELGAGPFWVLTGKHIILAKIASIAVIAAIVTTFINFDFEYALLTLGEILIGIFVTRMTPLGMRYFVLFISPVVLALIFGALWGFWYLG
jgi:hypothetical protein